MNQDVFPPTSTAIHERVCFKKHRSVSIGLLLIAGVESLFNLVSYTPAKSPAPPFTSLEVGTLVAAVVFLVLVAKAMQCLGERLVILLFGLTMVLELTAKGLAPHFPQLSRWIQYYPAVSLAIWIATALSALTVVLVSHQNTALRKRRE
jgi:hypothetical protein